MSDMPSGISAEAVKSFLDELSRLLGEAASTPDFDELYDIDTSSGAVGVVRASPDDIEAYVIMGLQQAELARENAEEETRVAAHWDIVTDVRRATTRCRLNRPQRHSRYLSSRELTKSQR
jgi:hypothetical protein